MSIRDSRQLPLVNRLPQASSRELLHNLIQFLSETSDNDKKVVSVYSGTGEKCHYRHCSAHNINMSLPFGVTLMTNQADSPVS